MWWHDADEEGGPPVPVTTEITDLRSATVNFSRPEQTYSNSSQGGVIGRDVGNLLVEGSFSRHTEDPTETIIEAVNSLTKRLRIGTDPGNQLDFYEFNRVIVVGVGPLSVDIEGGAMVEISQSWSFRPTYDVSGTPTKGNIANPASVTGNMWP